MSGTIWATDPVVELPVKMGQEGVSATPPSTVYEVFQTTVENHGEEPALKYQHATETMTVDTPWTTLSWSQYYMECVRFGKSLMSLGFQEKGCVNIIGFNSVEWFIANMGAIAAGGISAGIYASNLPEACQYITNHSKAEVVVVEDEMQLAKFAKVAAALTSVKAYVMYRGKVPENMDVGVPAYTWAQFMKLGSDIPASRIEERIKAQTPGSACSLIYTSGTTGAPKAVMISHDNLTWTAKVLAIEHKLNNSERSVSYLPLSHVAGQIMDLHVPMTLGSSIWFAQPDALRGSLVKTLRAVHPTVFVGVPRVWEKMYEKMQEVGRSIKGPKKSISTWAKSKGAAHAEMQQYGGGGGEPCGFGIANKLAFSKVKANLGLDEAKICVSAAAPIAKEVLMYFASLSIHIREVYGQSECTGPHTHNTKDSWKMGSVGRPLQGTESKIVPETGELCYRGRHVFMGYMHDPDKTAETVDEDGWLHSGDIARFDDDDDSARAGSPSGFVYITGRIKELLITAGGENIPPVLIENEFKTELPCIANCMVVGDRRKFLSILIALRTEVDTNGAPTTKLAGDSLTACEKMGSKATTIEEAKHDAMWIVYINRAVKACNARTTSNAQRVSKWALLPRDFSVEGGELTPTLKLKRGPASEKHSDIIEALYA